MSEKNAEAADSKPAEVNTETPKDLNNEIEKKPSSIPNDLVQQSYRKSTQLTPTRIETNVKT
jgi:hypothetical protein